MRRLLLAASLLVLALPLPASASCAAPELVVTGAVARPSPAAGGGTTPVASVVAGTAVEVVGGGFPNYCDDTGDTGGCARRPDPAPLDDVELLLVQGERREVLATADADEDYTARWRVRLPADLAPGRAVLVAGGVAVDLDVR